MIVTPFLRKIVLAVIVILCIVYSGRIYDGAVWILDHEKTLTISSDDRQISVTIPKGVASGPFSEPYQHKGYADSGNMFFYSHTNANPIVGRKGLSCFDAYERLIHIEVYGPGFLNFPTAILAVGPDAKPTRMEKHGDNIFFEYDGNSSSNDQTYYLAGSSTIFQLTYLPGNCAWKDHDYSGYLDKILSSVKLSDKPMTQVEIDETSETIKKYEAAGIIEPKENTLVDSQIEPDKVSVNQKQTNYIYSAELVVDGLISNQVIKTEDDCSIQIQKKNFTSTIENQAIIHCVDSIRDKKIDEQQSSAKKTYQICGNNYSVQKIDKYNGIDLVQRFAELATLSLQKNSCDDFNSIFKGKVIGLDLRDQNGTSHLTMYDSADDRYLQQIAMPTVAVSYDWSTKAMYYFPSTLRTGSANYMGNIK